MPELNAIKEIVDALEQMTTEMSSHRRAFTFLKDLKSGYKAIIEELESRYPSEEYPEHRI